MIAYIDLPLRGQSAVTGREVMVIAFVGSPDVNPKISLVYVDEDGSLGQAQLSEIKVNWRFDDRRRRWVDVDTGDELGDDDGDSPD